MSETNHGSTHRRMLIGHLVSIAAIIAVALAVMLLTAAFSTREFAVFLFGAGVFVGCLGLSHSHALKCARSELDPASRPGPELWIASLLFVAGVAAIAILRADEIPDTPLAKGAAAAAALGVVWAVLRGCRSIQRIGSPRV